jgi:hypothetical protein
MPSSATQKTSETKLSLCLWRGGGSPSFSFTPEALKEKINKFVQDLFPLLPLPPLINTTTVYRILAQIQAELDT